MGVPANGSMSSPEDWQVLYDMFSAAAEAGCPLDSSLLEGLQDALRSGELEQSLEAQINDPELFAMVAAYQPDSEEEEADPRSNWKRRAHDTLPFNSQLEAYNAAEFDVPLDVVAECRQLYEQHVKEELLRRSGTAASVEGTNDNRCHKWTSDEMNLFVQSPNPSEWKYSIDWVYPEDMSTRQ